MDPSPYFFGGFFLYDACWKNLLWYDDGCWYAMMQVVDIVGEQMLNPQDEPSS